MSAKEDMLARMALPHDALLNEIESFLTEAKMGASYFGKMATGNSELVSRLRGGGRVWPDTEAKVRAFIAVERHKRRVAA